MLAEQSGVSLPHLGRLESSQGNVSVVVPGKVAKALNQPLSSLFAEFEPLQKDKEHRIALIGLRGAGKSTVGRLLAERLGRPFVELNKEVEREAGISLQEIINFYDQAGYRNLERRCLERIVATYPDVILATGGGIVAEPLTYEILLSSFFTVWLRAEDEIHFRRVMEQRDLRIAKPELYREAMDNIHRTLEARDHLYSMASLTVDTTSMSVEEVVEKVASQAAGG